MLLNSFFSILTPLDHFPTSRLSCSSSPVIKSLCDIVSVKGLSAPFHSLRSFLFSSMLIHFKFNTLLYKWLIVFIMFTPSPSVLATLSEQRSLSTYSFSQLTSKHLNFSISVLLFTASSSSLLHLSYHIVSNLRFSNPS